MIWKSVDVVLVVISLLLPLGVAGEGEATPANTCRKCTMEGKQYEGDTDFVHKKDCLHYKCRCNCDGSIACPGKDTRNTCVGEELGGCRSCVLSENEFYKGETNFTVKQKCHVFPCQCNCDGSYKCSGKDARNFCIGEQLGGCRSCRISENEFHKGDTKFTLRQGCHIYPCKCNCDGSYVCPGKDARNHCRGERLGGCKKCALSETELIDGDTDFTFTKNCTRYECRCNCDGSWNCPGQNARNVCLGEVPGGCKGCSVEGQTYRAGTTFGLQKECIHYSCKCICNGGYTCPGEDARNTCRGEKPGGCRSCQISDNEFYPGESDFEMEKDCVLYKCRCDCQGAYSCKGGKRISGCKK